MTIVGGNEPVGVSYETIIFVLLPVFSPEPREDRPSSLCLAAEDPSLARGPRSLLPGLIRHS